MTFEWKKRLAGVSLAVLFSGPFANGARASEFMVEKIAKDSDMVFIALQGEIKSGDAEKFNDIALKNRSAVVVLNSPGGATYDALQIGRAIKIKGYNTIVFNNSICNSACALIWLSGSTRFLEDGAKVGFHASYVENSSGKSESGVGNALVGNYLSMLNLSEAAIVFATSAPPDKLNYLSLQNAAAVQIAAVRLGADETKNGASGGRQPKPDVGTTPVTSVGNWEIRSDSTMGGGCFAMLTFSGGYAFRFGYDARSGLKSYLVIAGEPWKSIATTTSYSIKIRFPEQAPWEAVMEGINLSGLKGLVVYFEDKGLAFQKELSISKSATISYDGKDVLTFDLSNSKEAVDALVECQLRHVTADDPFRH